MKTKKIFLILTIIFLIISNTSAMKFVSKQNAVITENINDDLYVVGVSVNVDSNIEGDVIIIGGFVNINANISGDLYCLGKEIKIEGVVGDDLLCAGDNLYVKNKVFSDTLLSGRRINFEGNSTNVWLGATNVFVDGVINNNLVVGADKVYINGEIYGNASVESSEMEFGNESMIKGLLNYSQVIKEEIEEPKFIKLFFWGRFIGLIASIINIIFFGLFLINWNPKIITKFKKEFLDKNIFQNFVIGFSCLLLLFFLSIFLFLTIFGFKLSALFLIIDLGLLFLVSTLISFWIGEKTEHLLKIRNKNLIQQLLIGSFIFSLISWIPYVGKLIKIVLISIGASVLLSNLKKKN